MAMQVNTRLARKVTFVGSNSCMKVGATAERQESGKDGEGQICIYVLLKQFTHQSLMALTSDKQREVPYSFRIVTTPHSVDSHTLVHVSWCVPCVIVRHIGKCQHPCGLVHWSHVVHLGGHLGEKDHTAVRGGTELHPIPSPGEAWSRDTKCTAGEGHILTFVHHIQLLECGDINLSTNWELSRRA